CLHVPALLLKTLEELTEEQMETFQSYLTSPQQSKYPPIPRSQLKNTDRLNTVDQMVKYWGLLRAVRTTVRILKEINKHDLAVKLEREYTEDENVKFDGLSGDLEMMKDVVLQTNFIPLLSSPLPHPSSSALDNHSLRIHSLSVSSRELDRMLPDQALLLKTLEVLTEKQMETFQFYLTSPQQSKYPPIPRSQLKNTDRQNTVDQMVKYWGLLVAVGSTVRILETINKHDLAVKLESDHIKGNTTRYIQYLTKVRTPLTFL
uniref:Pyrin domain-containing protein n=1 Tax=Esox lucius TaxID=8010 RepID=A0AAY5KP62_ESOLU